MVNWTPRGHWIAVEGQRNALVRTIPSPNGRFMWQFGKVVSYADTVDAAKDYVEAGIEYFDVMRRNPYL